MYQKATDIRRTRQVASLVEKWDKSGTDGAGGFQSDRLDKEGISLQTLFRSAP